MKYGFVKVAAVSPELKVADVKFNTLQGRRRKGRKFSSFLNSAFAAIRAEIYFYSPFFRKLAEER